MSGGVTVWFTGLSGAGKTTIARAVAERLRARGVPCELLDGDVVRQSLCRDLGFSPEDRQRNVERVTFVARLLTRHGVVVLVALISPYRAMRAYARREIGAFLEVYVRASLETLVRRDVKGLYRRALTGQLRGLTGVDDPYEEPERPDLVCDTDRETVAESAAKVIRLLEERGFLPRGDGQAPAVRVSAADAPPRTAAPAVPGPSVPHGGVLVDRQLAGEAREEALARAAHLPCVPLDPVALADLELIGVGAYSPLTGFMDRADYEAVVEHMRLRDGLVWTLPITLRVPREAAEGLREGQELALVDPDGRPVGIMQLRDRFRADKEREAQRVYGTADPAHPGVARLYRQGDVLLGGPVWLLRRPDPGPSAAPCLTPLEVRRAIAERGWRTVAGFQTRNPIHRAHEYLHKVALELVDGLLLHPLVGATKEDDVPAPVRLRCYQALLAGYYPRDRVLLAAFPAAMRYAGPREAVFHAIVRKNYGCTHFIVGRDHAGVGSYYGPFDAQALFDRFDPAELGIVPLKFDHAFYCRACGGMASPRTCPHGPESHVVLSGTRVREMLRRGQLPPPEFTRPEVARILAEALREPAPSGTAAGS